MTSTFSPELLHTLTLVENSKHDFDLKVGKDGYIRPSIPKSTPFLCYIWKKLISIFSGNEKVKSHALPVAEKVEKIFSQNQHLLKKGEALSFHYFLDAMARHYKSAKCAAKIKEISNRVFDKVIIEPKMELVNRAIKHLNNESGLLKGYANSEAKKFFFTAKERLKRKENVPLPEWYHATRTPQAINSILSSGNVIRTPAFKGYGAYVSSNDEAGEHIGYGIYTIAFDGEFLENSKASFFVPNPDHHVTGKISNWLLGWPHSSIWARVAQDLPVNKDTVAFLVSEPTYMSDLKIPAEKYHPEIPLISRNASKIIFSTLTEVSPKRNMPRRWTWMEGETKYPLPKVFVS